TSSVSTPPTTSPTSCSRSSASRLTRRRRCSSAWCSPATSVANRGAASTPTRTERDRRRLLTTGADERRAAVVERQARGGVGSELAVDRKHRDAVHAGPPTPPQLGRVRPLRLPPLP